MTGVAPPWIAAPARKSNSPSNDTPGLCAVKPVEKNTTTIKILNVWRSKDAKAPYCSTGLSVSYEKLPEKACPILKKSDDGNEGSSYVLFWAADSFHEKLATMS